MSSLINNWISVGQSIIKEKKVDNVTVHLFFIDPHLKRVIITRYPVLRELTSNKISSDIRSIMENSLIISFLVIIVMCTSIVFSQVSPRVTIRNGTLEGTVMQSRKGKDFYAFRGIPYASAPVGPLRFQPPQPPKPWKGIFNATVDGPDCPQQNYANSAARVEGSEDCLFINVYTPKSAIAGCQEYAVMVFFYGGFWTLGSGASTLYGPKYLMDHDIVLVLMNYRLGPLGFLSTADDAIPGNNALKDHVQALRWVQENIAVFGGDSNKVTIVGESTGAISVGLLMMSPLASGLFHQAITESGTSIIPFGFNTADMAKSSAHRLGKELNCTTTTSQALLTCLLTKDATDIAAQPLNWGKIDGVSRDRFLSVVESNKPGAFLTEEPGVLVKSGRFADIPCLNGLNSQEGGFFAVEYYLAPNLTVLKNFDHHFQQLAPATLGYEIDCSNASQNLISQKLREHYFGNKTFDESTLPNLVNLFSDNNFKYASATTVKYFLSKMKSPVYFYDFAYRGSLSYTNIVGDTVRNYGVSHTDELLYLFPVSEIFFGDKRLNETDLQMVDVMTELWTNFVRTGKPVPSTTRTLPVVWQPVTSNALESFVIGGPGNFTMTSNLYQGTLNFWSGLPCHAGLSRSKF